MLAELVHHVVGVDPDRDWITLAVLDARSAGVVAEGRFPATPDGYDEAVRNLSSPLRQLVMRI
jgi:transposase